LDNIDCQTCIGSKYVCVANTCECEDFDGDGYDVCSPGEIGDDSKLMDCDDSDGNVYPGATELCDDTLDNDCDGLTDCDDTDCAGNIACKNCDTDCNLCSSRPECLSSAAGCKWCTGPGAICLPQGSPVPPGYMCLL